MANEIIDINFTTIDSCASRIAQEIDLIQTKISEINSCYSSLDSRVKAQLGSAFDTTELETIKTRLENTKTFLGEVKKVYSGADIDLSDSLSVDYLEYLYPNFANLSDERKAIVLSALRYLGLNAYQMGYAKNFSSQYASSQFIGDATEHAWCAMFVGSIINYYFGDESIIDPSYASVWKIIGNYNGQTGIAFETDDRIHYYVSQALVDKYKANGGFPSWESNLAQYNSEHGTNIQVTDWINDGFVPQAGDILVFKQGNREYTLNKNGSLEEYNETVDRNKAGFIADTHSHDYPNDTQSYTHIGFVLGTREVDGVTYVDTVEGNVVNDVRVRSFRIDDPYLVGYGHIDYEKFDSDKQAIQNMVATGVDTSTSHATGETMSKHLLALHNGDLKGNYLVNLASNIDVAETQHLVVTGQTVTGQIATISTTTSDEPAVTTTQQQTTTTTTATIACSGPGASYHYQSTGTSQPTYSVSTQQTTQTTQQQTTTESIPVAVAVEPTTTVETTQPTTPVATTETVPSQPVTQEVTVVVPQTHTVEAPVVTAQIVETVATPAVTEPVAETPSTLEGPMLPEEDDFMDEMGRNDDWMDFEPQDTPSIPDDTIPSNVVSYETEKQISTTPPKSSSSLGKIALATLGIGAAAGGAAYIAHKAKQNNDTGEAEEEESEEEYSDEY